MQGFGSSFFPGPVDPAGCICPKQMPFGISGGFNTAANGSRISSTARPSAFCGRPGRSHTHPMRASLAAKRGGTRPSAHGVITATCWRLLWASVRSCHRGPPTAPSEASVVGLQDTYGEGLSQGAEAPTDSGVSAIRCGSDLPRSEGG